MGVSKKRRIEVYGKYNGRCAYCGNDINISDMYIDHIKPKLRGNSWRFDNFRTGIDTIENLNPSCFSCNTCKGCLDIEDFRDKICQLHHYIPSKYTIVKLARQYGLIEFNEFDGVFYFEKVASKENI